ncbi:MAG: hypothetical protein FJ291_28200 [Planctomycetes bacterium]|nr:hypothetical protein [Planctomycetota bacterium]
MASRGQSLTISYVAWDTNANAGKTGDAGNHTLRWVKDGASAAPSNSPSEVDATNAPGVYKLALTAAECACDVGVLCGKSATANVAIIPVTIAFEQLPTAAPGASGGLATVDASNRIAGVQGTKNTLDALNDVTAAAVKAAIEADGAKLDHLWETTEDDGGVRRFTANALEQAPTGGGGTTDWTADERKQIRKALGVAGTKAATADGNLDAVLSRVEALLGLPIAAQGAIVPAEQEIVRFRGDTVPIAFDLGRDITNASLAFTVKRRASDPQADALIVKSSAEDGEIELTNPAAGQFAVNLAADDTAALLPDGRRAAFLYDVEMALDGAVETIFAGAFILLPDVTTE